MPFKSFELAKPDDPIFSGGVKVFTTRRPNTAPEKPVDDDAPGEQESQSRTWMNNRYLHGVAQSNRVRVNAHPPLTG
jgi:hypothetical protein